MRVLILTPDVPFPTFKGQRADVWRRVQSLLKQDVRVAMIYFYDVENENHHSEFQKICLDLNLQAYGVPIKRTLALDLFRVLKSFICKVPYHALVRMPSKSDIHAIRNFILEFKPDAVWVEGLWIFETYKAIIKAGILKDSFYYRSHNVEFQYMYSQLSIDNSITGKFKRLIHTSLIKDYEISVLQAAKVVYDISYDDALLWKAQGFQNIEVLSPLPESAMLSQKDLDLTRNQEKIYDVLFLGNLRTPNNVQAIFFLIKEVLPLLKKRMPDIKVAVAGSNPTKSINELCLTEPSVELLVNVPDAFKLMCKARVLVNPVASGSGVMVKMLDLLMTNQPIVTMPQGIYGLPKEVSNTVTIVDDAAAFSIAISDYLTNNKLLDVALREKVRGGFSTEKIQEVLKMMESMK